MALPLGRGRGEGGVRKGQERGSAGPCPLTPTPSPALQPPSSAREHSCVAGASVTRLRDGRGWDVSLPCGARPEAPGRRRDGLEGTPPCPNRELQGLGCLYFFGLCFVFLWGEPWPNHLLSCTSASRVPGGFSRAWRPAVAMFYSCIVEVAAVSMVALHKMPRSGLNGAVFFR